MGSLAHGGDDKSAAGAEGQALNWVYCPRVSHHWSVIAHPGPVFLDWLHRVVSVSSWDDIVLCAAEFSLTLYESGMPSRLAEYGQQQRREFIKLRWDVHIYHRSGPFLFTLLSSRRYTTSLSLSLWAPLIPLVVIIVTLRFDPARLDHGRKMATFPTHLGSGPVTREWLRTMWLPGSVIYF